MPVSKPAQITFCYPSNRVNSRASFIAQILKSIPLDNELGYAGFGYKKYLKAHLEDRFRSEGSYSTAHLGTKERAEVTKLVKSAVTKSSKALPLKKPIKIFIFPWFDSENDAPFQGVTGFTPYKSVIHIHLSVRSFSPKSLQETIAHEYTHAVFFNYHDSANTLAQALVFEGLAEVFREEVYPGPHSPWVVALKSRECRTILEGLKTKLNSSNYDLYKNIFFGNDHYKRWTGYSIGYWIMIKFRNKNRELSWREIVALPPEGILNQIS